MQIKQNGLLYRLAYGRRKPEKRPTGKVNGCDVVWRAIGKVLWLIFMALVVLCISAFVGWILWGAITGLATLIWNAGAAIIAWLAHPQLPTVSPNGVFALKFIGVIVAAWLTICAVVFGIMFLALSKRETPRLIRAWLKAKKDKVCPIWDVV
jgi:hypothetical protein